MMRQIGARLLRDPTKGLVSRNCGESFSAAGGALMQQTGDGVQEHIGGLDLVRQNGAVILLRHPNLV